MSARKLAIVQSGLILLAAISLVYLSLYVGYYLWPKKYLDMSLWNEFGSNPIIEEKDNILERIQPQSASKWQTVRLQVIRPNTKNDTVWVRRTFLVSENKPYVFSVYVYSRYYNPSAKGSFTVIVKANEVEKKLNIADSAVARRVVLHGIKPRKGRIAVVFQLKSNINYKVKSWITASMVSFEYAQMYPE